MTTSNPFLEQTAEEKKVSHKAARHRHEKLSKAEAPHEGNEYVVVQGETPLYTARIVKYGGGCWGTVQVQAVMEGYENIFRADDTFDVRMAMYAWHPTAEDNQGEDNQARYNG